MKTRFNLRAAGLLFFGASLKAFNPIGFLAIVLLLTTCEQKSKPKDVAPPQNLPTALARPDQLKRTNFIDCEAKPSAAQQLILDKLMQSIKQDVDAGSYCGIPYHPLSCPPKNIAIKCGYIFDDISAYLKTHLSKLDFCIVQTSEWYAAVDTRSEQARIFVSTLFFKVMEDEQLRTLIHELHHLQGNLIPHTTDKTKCEYFDNDALRAEHCLTCGVSFQPLPLSNCSPGTDGLFIIKK